MRPILIGNYEKDTSPNIDSLKQFFEFNDKLDQSRNIKLADYIPELEQARKLL